MIALIGIGVIIIAIIFMSNKDNIINNVIDQSKVGIVKLLTEDHTEQEKTDLQDLFSNLVENIKETGVKEGLQENKEIIEAFYTILEDQKINKSESKELMNLYESLIGGSEKEVSEQK